MYALWRNVVRKTEKINQRGIMKPNGKSDKNDVNKRHSRNKITISRKKNAQCCHFNTLNLFHFFFLILFFFISICIHFCHFLRDCLVNCVKLYLFVFRWNSSYASIFIFFYSHVACYSATSELQIVHMIHQMLLHMKRVDR